MNSALSCKLEAISMDDRSYTIVTFHFGSTFWIKKCLENVDVFSDGRVVEVVVVNQDRNDLPELWSLPRVTRVVTFPVNSKEVTLLGHDHPSSINHAISSLEFKTSHVIIMDSDCFPISKDWLNSLPHAAAAGDPEKTGLTHPCFMVLPVSYLGFLSFSEGLVELGIDTGRLIGLQVKKMNLPLTVLTAQAAFSGVKGHFYNSRSLFHFGSGSFSGSTDPRLLNQVAARINAIFMSKVSQDSYDLSWVQKLFFATVFGVLKFREVVRS